MFAAYHDHNTCTAQMFVAVYHDHNTCTAPMFAVYHDHNTCTAPMFAVYHDHNTCTALPHPLPCALTLPSLITPPSPLTPSLSVRPLPLPHTLPLPYPSLCLTHPLTLLSPSPRSDVCMMITLRCLQYTVIITPDVCSIMQVRRLHDRHSLFVYRSRRCNHAVQSSDVWRMLAVKDGNNSMGVQVNTCDCLIKSE